MDPAMLLTMAQLHLLAANCFTQRFSICRLLQWPCHSPWVFRPPFIC